jgi:hypothetical protein
MPRHTPPASLARLDFDHNTYLRKTELIPRWPSQRGSLSVDGVKWFVATNIVYYISSCSASKIFSSMCIRLSALSFDIRPPPYHQAHGHQTSQHLSQTNPKHPFLACLSSRLRPLAHFCNTRPQPDRRTCSTEPKYCALETYDFDYRRRVQCPSDSDFHVPSAVVDLVEDMVQHDPKRNK